MAKDKYNHIHRYKAVNPSTKTTYKCIVQGCPHTCPATLLEGRKACCPECEHDFYVTEEHLRRVNITCIGCGRSGFTAATRKKPVLPSEAGQILDKFKRVLTEKQP